MRSVESYECPVERVDEIEDSKIATAWHVIRLEFFGWEMSSGTPFWTTTTTTMMIPEGTKRQFGYADSYPKPVGPEP